MLLLLAGVIVGGVGVVVANGGAVGVVGGAGVVVVANGGGAVVACWALAVASWGSNRKYNVHTMFRWGLPTHRTSLAIRVSVARAVSAIATEVLSIC